MGCHFLIALLLAFSINARADTITEPSWDMGKIQTTLNSGRKVEALVVYTTDGAGNVIAAGAQGGMAKGEFVRNAYASTNVTTGAYVQLIAATGAVTNRLQIFDSCGQTLKLAVGGSGSEVDQILIFPGGNGDVPLRIAAGARVSVRAVSGNCTTGELDINLLK